MVKVFEGIIMNMKIFRMNDCDWCAGEDLESVVEFYMDFVDLDKDEACDQPCELTELDMDRLIFTPDSKDEDLRTFREELKRLIDKGEKFPMFFASTEF